MELGALGFEPLAGWSWTEFVRFGLMGVEVVEVRLALRGEVGEGNLASGS